MKRFSPLLAMFVAVALVFAGCGSSSSSSSSAGGGGSAAPASTSTAGGGSSGSSATPTNNGHLAKSRFVLHAGLAFGAFHRYIYKPLRAGVFGRPSTHKVALVKAALATAFAIHELKLAYEAALGSPTLSKLVSPITAVKAKLTGLVDGFKAGRYDKAQINSAQSDVASISSQAAGAGAVVKDLPVPAF